MVFRFAQPEWLWLLLLLPLLALLKSRQGPAGALRFPSTAILHGLAYPTRGLPGKILLALRWGSLAALTLALARPQTGSGTQWLDSSGVDIVLAVDLSGSMWAHDFEIRGQPVDRLTAVKAVVRDFIQQRPNDRLSLIAFSTDPYLVSPLTLNHSWLLEQVDRLRIGLIDPNRTAVGSALAMAANRLRDLEAKSRVIVLLTDGESNHGEIGPIAAAEAAAALGVRVYTIAAGREGMVPFPQIGRDGQPVRDARGRPVLQMGPSQIDVGQLRRMAEITQGRFYRAQDTEQLRQIYEDINQLERTEVALQVRMQYADLFHHFLAAALLLLAVELVLGQTRFQRLP